jgi:hypothetical protein
MLWPLASSAALLIIGMIHCVRRVITKASSGRIRMEMAAFDSTAVRSETSSDSVSLFFATAGLYLHSK